MNKEPKEYKSQHLPVDIIDPTMLVLNYLRKSGARVTVQYDAGKNLSEVS